MGFVQLQYQQYPKLQKIISLLALTFLLLLINIPTETTAKHEPRCDRNCQSKATYAQRSTNCGICCRYINPKAKGSCGRILNTKKCMCSGSSQIPSLFNFNNMPSICGGIGIGGLCLSATNSARANHGKRKLKYNLKLQAAARKHNTYMIRTNCYEHDCPGEPGLAERTTSSGYRFSIAAENLIAGHKDDCSVHVKRWLASPGHNANLLNDKVTELGCYEGTCNRCLYKYYITCVYAAPLTSG